MMTFGYDIQTVKSYKNDPLVLNTMNDLNGIYGPVFLQEICEPRLPIFLTAIASYDILSNPKSMAPQGHLSWLGVGAHTLVLWRFWLSGRSWSCQSSRSEEAGCFCRETNKAKLVSCERDLEQSSSEGRGLTQKWPLPTQGWGALILLGAIWIFIPSFVIMQNH